MIKNKLKNVVAVIVVVSGLALGVGSAYAVPAFVNGGFESDSWSSGSTSHVTPFGWNAVQSSDSRFVRGEHNTSDTTSNYTPFGNQFIELCAQDCSDGQVGNVSQTLSGFIVGAQYRLDFEQTPEDYDSLTENALVQVTIAGGGTLTKVFNAIDVGASCCNWALWKHQSWIFTANSPTLTFTFAGSYISTNGKTNNYESGIDNITLTQMSGDVASIPTLSQWGMILFAILLASVAAFTLRRQRQ